MDTTKLSTTINATTSKTGFSGVIHVRQGEQTLYQKAFGYADRSNSNPNALVL